MKKSCIIFIAVMFFGFTQALLARADQTVDVNLQFEQDPTNTTEVGNPTPSDDTTQAGSKIIKVYGTDESGQEEAEASGEVNDTTINKGNANEEAQYYLDEEPAVNILILAQQEGIYDRELENLAKQQAISDSSLQDAKVKIEKRGKLRKFILGPDFKNLKIVTELIKQNADNIAKLKGIAEKMDNSKVKSELLAQLERLRKNNQMTQEYAIEKSRQFSLLGWLLRFFN